MSDRVPLETEVFIDDDRPQRLSSGMWWAIGLLAASTFGAGLGAGVLIDGTAEVINEFNAKSAKSCTPTKAEQAVIVPVDAGGTMTTGQAATSIATVAPAHPNNEINWMISVAPGTPTAKIEVRNADPEHGAKLDFGTTDGTTVRTSATVWVEPAGIATLSLPLGRYAIRAQRLDKNQTNDGPAVAIPTLLPLTSSEDAPTVAGTSSGRWQITGLDKPIVRTKPIRRRRSTSDEEYRGLGPADSGANAPTYG